MPEPTPEQEEAIRELAAMPDEFYRMYEASGNIVMIQGVNFARRWVAHQEKSSPQTNVQRAPHEEVSDCSVQL